MNPNNKKDQKPAPSNDADTEATSPTASVTEKKLKVPARLKMRKDPSLPRRPLCAYNIFFKLQRKRILEERARSRREGKLSKDEESLFSSMAKTIGSRWHSVSPETLQYCLDEAERDKARYQFEMKLYDLGKFVPESERQRQKAELKSSPMVQGRGPSGPHVPPFAHGQLAHLPPQPSSAESMVALEYHLWREQEQQRSNLLLRLASRHQPSTFADPGLAQFTQQYARPNLPLRAQATAQFSLHWPVLAQSPPGPASLQLPPAPAQAFLQQPVVDPYFHTLELAQARWQFPSAWAFSEVKTPSALPQASQTPFESLLGRDIQRRLMALHDSLVTAPTTTRSRGPSPAPSSDPRAGKDWD